MNNKKKKLNNLNNFHTCFMELLTTMEETFQQNEKLKTYNANYPLLIKSNTLQPIKYFKDYMLQYKNEILKSDINFFLTLPLKEMKQKSDTTFLEVLQIKELWKSCDETIQNENTETLFKYLKLLVLFTEEYFQENITLNDY